MPINQRSPIQMNRLVKILMTIFIPILFLVGFLADASQSSSPVTWAAIVILSVFGAAFFPVLYLVESSFLFIQRLLVGHTRFAAARFQITCMANANICKAVASCFLAIGLGMLGRSLIYHQDPLYGAAFFGFSLSFIAGVVIMERIFKRVFQK